MMITKGKYAGCELNFNQFEVDMANPKHSVRSLLNIAHPKKLSLSQIKGITRLEEGELREILKILRESNKIKTLDYGEGVGRLYWFNGELLEDHPNRNLRPKRSADVNH